MLADDASNFTWFPMLTFLAGCTWQNTRSVLIRIQTEKVVNCGRGEDLADVEPLAGGVGVGDVGGHLLGGVGGGHRLSFLLQYLSC